MNSNRSAFILVNLEIKAVRVKPNSVVVGWTAEESAETHYEVL